MNTQNQQDGAALAPVAGSALSSVFELIEHQHCEDGYYPLGIYLTLADAIAVVEEHGVNICNDDPDEWAEVEIRERRIGLSDSGTAVWKRTWERDWSDDNASDKWKIVSQPNTKITNSGA